MSEVVDFEELVASIRLAAKSALRNPEWVPIRERQSPQTKEVKEAAYAAWAHRHFRELQSSPQLRTIHWAQFKKAQAWLKQQRDKGKSPTYRDLAMRFGWQMYAARFVYSYNSLAEWRREET